MPPLFVHRPSLLLVALPLPVLSRMLALVQPSVRVEIFPEPISKVVVPPPESGYVRFVRSGGEGTVRLGDGSVPPTERHQRHYGIRVAPVSISMIGARWNRGVRLRPPEGGSAACARGLISGAITGDPHCVRTHGRGGKPVSGIRAP